MERRGLEAQGTCHKLASRLMLTLATLHSRACVVCGPAPWLPLCCGSLLIPEEGLETWGRYRAPRTELGEPDSEEAGVCRVVVGYQYVSLGLLASVVCWCVCPVSLCCVCVCVCM